MPAFRPRNEERHAGCAGPRVCIGSFRRNALRASATPAKRQPIAQDKRTSLPNHDVKLGLQGRFSRQPLHKRHGHQVALRGRNSLEQKVALV